MSLLEDVHKLQKEAIDNYYEFAKIKLFDKIREDPWRSTIFLQFDIPQAALNEIICCFNRDGIAAGEYGRSRIRINIPSMVNSHAGDKPDTLHQQSITDFIRQKA